MNELEATRAKLKCLEMVDGTGLDWWEVITAKGFTESFNAPPEFNLDGSEYIIALGVVEGKPVWDGDTVWFITTEGAYYRQIATIKHDFKLAGWSWNPPKPKTVMVELTVEDAEHLSNVYGRENSSIHLACRKALEELK